MSLTHSIDDQDLDLVIGISDSEPTRHTVRNERGEAIGHIDLRLPEHAVNFDEFVHLRNEHMHLRNLVGRLQSQVKLLENKLNRH
jgi:hypothetical protein